MGLDFVYRELIGLLSFAIAGDKKDLSILISWWL